MRYTKAALLIFGLGVVLGLVVVAAELPGLQRAASGVMALGLVLLPVGLVADGRGTGLIRWLRGRLSRSRKPKRRPRTTASVRRPAARPGRRRGATRAPRRKGR